LIVGSLYILGAILVSFDLRWDDPKLPRLSWLAINNTHYTGSSSNSTFKQSDSAFVIAASDSVMTGSHLLADFINVCVIITALTTANTTLYVASRTLFSLTKGIQDTSDSSWIKKFLAFFGKTNRRRVPMRAIAASTCFCWAPFLYLGKRGYNLETVSGTLYDKCLGF